MTYQAMCKFGLYLVTERFFFFFFFVMSKNIIDENKHKSLKGMPPPCWLDGPETEYS